MSTRYQNFLLENNDISKIVHILYTECSDVIREIKKAKKRFLYRGTHKPVNIIRGYTPRDDRRPKDTSQWMHDNLNDLFKDRFGWRAREEGVFATGNGGLTGYGTVRLFFPVDGFKFLWNSHIEDLTVHLGDYAKDEGPTEGDYDDVLYEYEGRFGPETEHGHWKLSDGRSLGTMKDIKKNKRVTIEGFITKSNQVWYMLISYKDDKEEFEEDAEWVPNTSFEDFEEDYYNEQRDLFYDRAMEEAELAVRGYSSRGLPEAIESGNEIMFKCKKYYLVETRFAEDLMDTIIAHPVVDIRQTSFAFMKEAKEQEKQNLAVRNHFLKERFL